MKKISTIFALLNFFIFGLMAQTFTPIGWFSWGTAVDFSENPYSPKQTIQIKKMPESWNYDANTVDFDALWSILGDSMIMANHVKAGGDVFDGGTSCGSFWKAFYAETALYVLLKFIDKDGLYTDHGWELAFQSGEKDRYEPDFTAAGTDLGLKNSSYARYLPIGGKKVKIVNGMVAECNGNTGKSTWANTSVGLEQLNTDVHYWNDELGSEGLIRAIVVLDYTKVLAYLTDPATGNIDVAEDYTAFDPAVKPIISWDCKAIGLVDGVNSDYWWNSLDDNAYITTYYCGYLEFLDEEISTSVINYTEPEIKAIVKDNTLRLTGIERTNIKIYNITGQLVKSGRNVNQIFVGDLNKGISLIQIDEIPQVIKFVR